MRKEVLEFLVFEKGIDPADFGSAVIYEDGFIFLRSIEINGQPADNLIVGRVNERYSTALLKGLMTIIKKRERLLVSFIDGNYEEMKCATLRTGGEVLENNYCLWRM